MTINTEEVYLKAVSCVAGKEEAKGTFKNLYDKTYLDYYMKEKTFEQAEMTMIEDSVKILKRKSGVSLKKIDTIIGSDLLNQNTVSSYSAVNFKRPFLGIYNACASLCEEFIIASSLLDNNKIKNVLCTISSHNLTAERQYRNPIEYGAPKPKRATFTVTGAAAFILSNHKSKIKVERVSIGTPVDLNVTDIYDMGAVMAPAAAKTIYEHLKDTNTSIDDYDLIITGDLGVYGKDMLKEYMKDEYDIDLGDNYLDAGSIIYDRKKQKKVRAGGSGPVCLPLVLFTDIYDKMIDKKLNRVLVVATGALMSPTMNNQKLSIPAIAHAIELRRVS